MSGISPDAGTDLVSCSNVTGTDTSYCCAYKPLPNCCNEGVGRFEVLPSKAQVWATWNENLNRYVPLHQSTSSPPSSSTQPPTTFTTAKAITTPEPTTSTAPQPSTSSMSTPSSGEAAQSQPQSTSSSPLSLGAQVGIGAGAGALVLAFGAVVFLLLQLRKKTQLEKAHGVQGQVPGSTTALREEKFDPFVNGYYQYPSGGLGLGVAETHEMDGRGARFELASTPSVPPGSR